MERSTKRYRFFYHYYKKYKKMSVHFKGECYMVDNVECMQPCNTKWCKTQPNLRMEGFAESVTIMKNNRAFIL